MVVAQLAPAMGRQFVAIDGMRQVEVVCGG